MMRVVYNLPYDLYCQDVSVLCAHDLLTAYLLERYVHRSDLEQLCATVPVRMQLLTEVSYFVTCLIFSAAILT